MKYLWVRNPNGDDVCVQPNSADLYRGVYNMTTMNNNQQHKNSNKTKRVRSAFTTDQVNFLEKQFKEFPYIGNAHRKEVAMALKIPERAIKIWFQNRRMKEKKETSTKECDDDQTNRKSVEFPKDRLNNISVQSANEQQQYSLPLLAIKNMNDDKSDVCVTNNSASSITVTQSTVAVDTKNEETTNQDNQLSTSIKRSYSPINYKTSAEFSINLCKKYKSESNNKLDFAQGFKADLSSDQNPQLLAPAEQLIPEDLSSTRKIDMPVTLEAPTQGSTRNVTNNPGYISVIPNAVPLYAQPYISPGGVIWKPINVVPVVSSGSSVAPTNQIPIPSPIGVPKGICNCDCHTKPPTTVAYQQSSPGTQYIITAVPFQNPSVKL